jgi:hypothetical protein
MREKRKQEREEEEKNKRRYKIGTFYKYEKNSGRKIKDNLWD